MRHGRQGSQPGTTVPRRCAAMPVSSLNSTNTWLGHRWRPPDGRGLHPPGVPSPSRRRLLLTRRRDACPTPGLQGCRRYLLNLRVGVAWVACHRHPAPSPSHRRNCGRKAGPRPSHSHVSSHGAVKRRRRLVNESGSPVRRATHCPGDAVRHPANWGLVSRQGGRIRRPGATRQPAGYQGAGPFPSGIMGCLAMVQAGCRLPFSIALY